VFALGLNDSAIEELIKGIDFVNGSYITDRYEKNDSRYEVKAANV
jgi:hypothetical protein